MKKPGLDLSVSALFGAVALLGCVGSGRSGSVASEAVQARLASELERVWVRTQNNDMSTSVWELELRDGVATETAYSVPLRGERQVRSIKRGRYSITSAGSLELSLGDEGQRFTAVVLEGEVCAALLATPGACPVLVAESYLADAERAGRYQREWSRWQKGAGATTEARALTAALTFSPPLPEAISGGGCQLDLEITARVQGLASSRRPARRAFSLPCRVERAAGTSLWRVTAEGFGTDPSVRTTEWANYLGREQLVADLPYELQALFNYAFQPVMYLDPDRPEILFSGIYPTYVAAPPPQASWVPE
jgi:hypothetical protein